MSVMGAAMLSTSRKLMGTHDPNNWVHISVISIWVRLPAHVQDFRDQDGDRKRGRHTFPLAFGDTTARYIVAFFLLPLAFATTYLMGLGKNAPWLLAAMHIFLGYRLLAFRESKADHDTYTVLLLIFCVMTALCPAQTIGLLSPDSPLEAKILQYIQSAMHSPKSSLATAMFASYRQG